MFGIRLACLTVLSLLATDAMATENIRQSRAVTVEGKTEVWRLKWAGAVKPVCSAAAPTPAATCPCIGYAYGEQGHLFLERDRDGAVVDNLNLSTLFGAYDTPADAGNAALIRFPREANDPFDTIDDTPQQRQFDNAVQQRAPADVMQVADFSQDGMQASFLLQVGNAPCGKREMALIGVSRRQPHLHAFSTTAHPERPLVLQDRAWMALAAAGGHATFTDWTCGDHGSENEVEQIIRAHDGMLSVQANTYACRPDGSRGALIRSREE